MRHLDKYVDIVVSLELKAKELEKRMTDNLGSPKEKPLIDTPIRSSADDDLERAPVAHAFARSILELDASQGLVVGVFGPWGHGKSSFINLMREEFQRTPKKLESSEESEPAPEESKTIQQALTVIDFNPWMFSGSDQLVDFFFDQVGAELNVKDKKLFGTIADSFKKYAGIIKPVFSLLPVPGNVQMGEIVEGVVRGTAETMSPDRSVHEVKQEITSKLNDHGAPIVVVIDDIDRLTKTEIREIFKLVRLTASFPNIIYLLAFDRERVEQVLSEDGFPGRAYLEKIVQLSFDVPQAQEKLLQSRVSAELNRILGPITSAPFNESRWHDTYFTVIAPLFSNMRDVVRYAISAKPTIKDLGDKVDLVDLLAMEALRVFRPEIFQRLPTLRNELTKIDRTTGSRDRQSEETITHKLRETFPNDKDVIHWLLKFVFPAAPPAREPGSPGSWRAAHRMADIEFLNLYFDRVAPDQLVAFEHSEYALSFLNDRARLKKYLIESVSPEMLKDVIHGFTFLEKKFTDDMAVPGSIALLNLIDALPEKSGPLDSEPEDVIRRVVSKLLGHVQIKEKREEFAQRIFEDVETYSSKIYFIDEVLGRAIDGIGSLPVESVFRGKLRMEFAERVQETPPPKPQLEWCIGRVYNAFVQATYPNTKALLSANDDPVLLQKVLHSLKSVELTQSSDSSQIQSDDYLEWKDLVKLFESEDEIRAVLDKVPEEFGDNEVFQLVDSYLDGWRSELSQTGQSQAKETKN